MTGGPQPTMAPDQTRALRNKKLVLKYQDALSGSDLKFIESKLDPNFTYVRLAERFSRHEYLDALSRTLLASKTRRLHVESCLADNDRVSLEVSMEFDFQGKSVRGQYLSVYEIENDQIVALREYGGLLD